MVSAAVALSRRDSGALPPPFLQPAALIGSGPRAGEAVFSGPKGFKP